MPYGAITFATSAYGKTLQRHLLWVVSGLKIDQVVVMVIVRTVESSVLKCTPYCHRRVLKPSTNTSSIWKAKVSKCGVTSNREFAVFVFSKDMCDPSKRASTLGRALSVADDVCKPRGVSDRYLCRV